MPVKLFGENVIFLVFLGGLYDLDYNAACEPVKLSGENVIFVVFLESFMTLIEMLLVCL